MATRGRKKGSGYKPTKADLAKIEQAASEGLPRRECAKILNISSATYYRNNEAFEAVYKKGYAECAKFRNEVAVNSFFRRVTGYEYTETTKEREAVPNKDGEVKFEMVTTKEVIKSVAPNVTAFIFWAVNRMPEEWRSINKDHDDRNQNYTGNFQFHVIERSDDNGKS